MFSYCSAYLSIWKDNWEESVKDSASIGALNIRAAGTREEFRIATEKPENKVKVGSSVDNLRYAILQKLDTLTTIRNTVIEYLVKAMPLVSVQAVSTIRSYDITIAAKGTQVTPASWLKITEIESDEKHNDGTKEAQYDPSLLMLLLAPIRLAKATVSEYRNTSVRKISDRYDMGLYIGMSRSENARYPSVVNITTTSLNAKYMAFAMLKPKVDVPGYINMTNDVGADVDEYGSIPPNIPPNRTLQIGGSSAD